MHDTVIAQSIVRDLKKMGRVKEATLAVGELYGVEPDHLLEHLKEVSRINFTIEQVQAKVRCDCGYEGRPLILERFHDFVLHECPECHSSVKILEGDDIIIKEVKK